MMNFIFRRLNTLLAFLLSCVLIGLPALGKGQARTYQLVLSDDSSNQPVISKHIYGHFTEHLGRCIYDGIMRNGVVRNDIIEALREIATPNIRWPGGCYADNYNWRDGVGSVAQRPRRVNSSWGMVEDDNSFGLHEFIDLCRRIGAEPYIATNVGSGTPLQTQQQLEYLNFGGKSELSALRAQNGHPAPFGVSWFGMGNENWGCGGEMTPEYYADLYKRYANYAMTYPGAPPLRRIAGGANADDYRWTQVLMEKIPAHLLWGISVHYYTWLTGQWPPTGSSENVTGGEYTASIQQAMRLDTILAKHIAIMDRKDPQNKVALLVDEWGIWTKALPGNGMYYQNGTLRDAIVAGLSLNILANEARRVKGANLAQAVNVIHSVILTKEDSLVKTPTYHVFKMYKAHHDARLCKFELKGSQSQTALQRQFPLSVSASVDSNKVVHVTLVNTDPSVDSDVQLPGYEVVKSTIISSASVSDGNSFSKPNQVTELPFSKYSITGDQTQITIPAHSIVAVELKKRTLKP